MTDHEGSAVASVALTVNSLALRVALWIPPRDQELMMKSLTNDNVVDKCISIRAPNALNSAHPVRFGMARARLQSATMPP